MNAAVEMKALAGAGGSRFETHEVRNQAVAATGFNAFSGDAVLRAAIAREAPWAAERCAALGALAGDEQVQEAARLANKHIPELTTHDRFGHRIDWVEFHPAWHQLMQLAYRHQVHALAWTAREHQPHYARAVLSYLWNQVEHGTGCPTGMAYAAHAGFSGTPALKIWADKVAGSQYDFSRAEVASKKSVVIGYAMTEKQGGSDLRETQTTALYSHRDSYHGERADWYRLTGHKWFCSVPVSDGFFTLAKVGGGVTCFFLPRTLPDGSFNRFFIQRLKDKCGNKSNALRVAKASDHLDSNPQQRAFARIATPVAKYFNCSRAPAIANEALQCHGGNGFVEENPIARLYREAPLNSVWEGTANMMCMDVRRSIVKDRATLDAVKAELAELQGADARFDRFAAQAVRLAERACDEEFVARAATEALARAIQGAELIRHSTSEVADAFIATRLGGAEGASGSMFGTLAMAVTKATAHRIVERAQVAA